MPNDHPPIPPNNERFVTIDGVVCFMVELEAEPDDDDIQLSMPVEIDKLRGYGKRDCANAARCAWLDEAERLDALKRAVEWIEHEHSWLENRRRRVTKFLRKNNEKLYVDLKRARTNADAWAAWGKEASNAPKP